MSDEKKETDKSDRIQPQRTVPRQQSQPEEWRDAEMSSSGKQLAEISRTKFPDEISVTFSDNINWLVIGFKFGLGLFLCNLLIGVPLACLLFFLGFLRH